MLFCDLDGVLANFIGGFEKKFKQSFHSMDEDKAWKLIEENPELWFELDPFDGAVAFFSKIRRFGPTILTSLPHSSFMDSAKYKRMWVKKFLGSDVQMIPCVGGKNKAAYMHDVGDILIDDMLEKNCVEWTRHGGVAIHHPEGSDHNITLQKVHKLIIR